MPRDQRGDYDGRAHSVGAREGVDQSGGNYTGADDESGEHEGAYQPASRLRQSILRSYGRPVMRAPAWPMLFLLFEPFIWMLVAFVALGFLVLWRKK